MTSKTCCRCKATKDTSEFHRNGTKRDGLYPCCKTCKNVPAKPLPTTGITPEELAWLSGLYEGEGNVNMKRVGPPKYRTNYIFPSIKIAMVDEDVIKKAQALTGFGRVTCQHPPSQKQFQPTWVWTVAKSDEVELLLNLMLPFMGRRRTEQIVKILNEWKESRTGSTRPDGRCRPR